MSRGPAYRIDVEARIRIRERDRAAREADAARKALDAAVEQERDLVTCQSCRSKFNVRHWEYCPTCAVRAFPRPTEPAA